MITTIFEAIILVVIVIILFLQSGAPPSFPSLPFPAAGRHVFHHGGVWLFAEQPHTVWLGPGHRHRSYDAIVVVENVERYLRQGLRLREAAYKTMEEVGGALVAIALVLCAVFIPTAFITAEYLRCLLSAVRADNRCLDDHLSHRLADAVTGVAALLLRPHDHEQRPGFGAP